MNIPTRALATPSLNRSECLVYVWLSVSVHITVKYSKCLNLEVYLFSPPGY